MNSLDAWLNFFKDFDLPDTIAQDYAILFTNNHNDI